MEKINSILSDLKKATERLKEAALLPPTEINQDATIQRFEFCFELSWKLMQTISRENGLEVYGPRDSIREGARLGLVADPELWFEFLKARNLTTHLYEEKIAKEVYQKAKVFVKALEILIAKAQKKINA